MLARLYIWVVVLRLCFIRVYYEREECFCRASAYFLSFSLTHIRAILAKLNQEILCCEVFMLLTSLVLGKRFCCCSAQASWCVEWCERDGTKIRALCCCCGGFMYFMRRTYGRALLSVDGDGESSEEREREIPQCYVSVAETAFLLYSQLILCNVSFNSEHKYGLPSLLLWWKWKSAWTRRRREQKKVHQLRVCIMHVVDTDRAEERDCEGGLEKRRNFYYNIIVFLLLSSLRSEVSLVSFSLSARACMQATNAIHNRHTARGFSLI